jgi:hypothetical protein
MLDMTQNRLQALLSQRQGMGNSNINPTQNRLSSILGQMPQQNRFQAPQYAAPSLPAMRPNQQPANPFAGMPQRTGNFWKDVFTQVPYLKSINWGQG